MHDMTLDQHPQVVWVLVAGLLALGVIVILLLVRSWKRKRTQASLTAANQRFQNMFDNTAVALIEEDFTAVKAALDQLAAEGVTDFEAYFEAHPLFLSRMAELVQVTDVNPAALRMYGAADKEAFASVFPSIFAPDTSEAVKKLLLAIIGGGALFECETVNRTLDQHLIHVLVSLSLPDASGGDYRGIFVSVIDITDLKRSEDALRRSEERFRTVFNHAASGMAMIDREGNYLRVNKALERMLGYSAQALMQMNWRDVTHPDDIPQSEYMIQEIAAGSTPPAIEKRYITRQGQSIWALVNLAALPTSPQGPLYYIAQMQDISSIKAARAKLQEREERYRQIFEADLSGIYVVTAGRQLVMCNLVFARMLGFDSVEEVLGKDFASFYKDPTLGSKIIAELTRDKKIEHYEMEFLRCDGKIVHVRINAIGRFDDLGRLIEMQGYILDITRQKSLESQLLHAQKMESVGTMAGGVAHDFNNLLMGIMGNASLLMGELGESHPSLGRLQNIQQYVESGSDLTRQLLGFAKGGKYEVRTTDLNRLISRNLTMFARTHKNIRVHTELLPELWSVEADRTQIDQVLYNLYVNAWQAMENGGDLFISTGNQVLDTQSVAPVGLPPGRYVQITVKDTGHGIPAAILPRIFDPFFTTKARGRGTGLGLASAYGIVKSHGGFITVQSSDQGGATFSVFLPASESRPMEADAAPRTKVRRGSGTILLVDDEEIIIDAIGAMISNLGYSLYTAGSGAEAVKIYRERGAVIDLVILDMVMPGMGGGETFERLKAVDPNVQVILCSGYSAEGNAAEILRRGCRGFLQKPFSLNELSGKLSAVFERQHARDCAAAVDRKTD